MEIQIRENETFIRLGQALKKAGLVSSGIEAKMVILDGLVNVNEETETRRGRKLYSGDAISFGNEIIKIKK